MKLSSVSFSQLRRLLLDLHFNESRANSCWRFEHSSSETVFVFRPYASSDNITLEDLAPPVPISTGVVSSLPMRSTIS
jgi:hypothetical protein